MLALLFLMTKVYDPPRPLGKEAEGGEVTAVGSVEQIRERAGDGQKQLIISLHSVTFCSGAFPDLNGKNKREDIRRETADGILCYMAQGETPPLYGERIRVTGTAENFRSGRNPGGFDARGYYRAQGIDFYVTDTRIAERGRTYGGFRQALYTFRRHMAETLDRIGGEDAGVIEAMLLGDKDALPEETKELYERGGISHILAISGLHVSFLGLGLYRLLKRLRLPIPAAIVLSAAVLFCYVVMTGASPSSRRAGMMFGFGLLAELLGRSCDRMTVLSLSALISAAAHPLWLGQSGFLMSYGAILGLELVYPALERVWSGRPAGLFLAGFSVCGVTLPVILYTYFELPVYSFFLNLFVIPLMGVVMVFSLGALAAGSFSVALGRALFVPVHLILRLFRAGCGLTEKLPGNMWITGRPAMVQIFMYYGLLLLFVLLKKYMTKPVALLLLGGALWILTQSFRPVDTLTMLDVGQGDGIVIRSGKGKTVLVDCGSSSEKALTEYTLLPYLKSEGIRELEYVFLTHMDGDHISGVEGLLTENAGEIRIDTLVLPAVCPDEAYERVVQEAERMGIRICSMGRGDRLRIDDLDFICLHPGKGSVYEDRNEGSLVLHLSKGKFSALLTGDLDGGAEEELAHAYPAQLGKVTVLKVGHHGSKYACGQALLDKCSPRIALISCGEGNGYGHPDTGTLRRLEEAGSRVYVTKDTGALMVSMGAGNVAGLF